MKEALSRIPIAMPLSWSETKGFRSGSIMLFEAGSIEREGFEVQERLSVVLQRWGEISAEKKALAPHMHLFSPPEPTSLRFEEWVLSRLALLDAIEETVARDSGALSDQKFLISIAHSAPRKGAGEGFIQGALAACISLDASGSEKGAGVGVDLELADRCMSDRAIERMILPTEQRLGLLPLEIWCVKEAAFKATSAALGGKQKGAVLSDFSIESREGERFSVRDQTRSDRMIRAERASVGRWMLAFAFSP